MAQKVTMEDVARQSGVSLATVSLVIRGRPGINDETRQRVLEAARALGYQKRSPADGHAARTAQTVGVLIKGRADDAPLANPFYAPLLAGIEAACRKSRLNLLFATIPVNLDNHPIEVPRLLEEGDVDGIMLVGAFVDETVTRLIERRALPLVLVDAYTEACYDIVGTDNFRGAYQAVTYLLDCGHRRIGLVGTQPDAYPSLRERRRGYIQALEDHGIAEGYFGDCRIASDEELDAAVRLLPGALNHGDSAAQDSFADGLLDCPHYTKPREWMGLSVPEVLLNGDHAKIAQWRLERMIERTRERRPDLL